MQIVQTHEDGNHLLLLTAAEWRAIRFAIIRQSLRSMQDVEEQMENTNSDLRDRVWVNWRVSQALALDIRDYDERRRSDDRT